MFAQPSIVKHGRRTMVQRRGKHRAPLVWHAASSAARTEGELVGESNGDQLEAPPAAMVNYGNRVNHSALGGPPFVLAWVSYGMQLIPECELRSYTKK